LIDNLFEPIHRTLKIKLCLARLRFATHGGNGRIKHSLAGKKARLADRADLLPAKVLADKIFRLTNLFASFES
jgi:hypothetical protein